MGSMKEPFAPTEKFDIRLAIRVMRHISSGIYRDRAGSVRELVSNSFDAQATEVTIQTGAPRFETVIVEDNGLGMEADIVRESFTHVGLSYKQIHPERYTGTIERPMIGRFGIGFLAAAHISDEIWMDSFTAKSKVGIRVHVNLKPYFLYQDSVETFDKFEFGTVEIAPVDKTDLDHGTRVELRNVRLGRFFNVLNSPGHQLVKWPARGQRESTGGRAISDLVKGIEASNLLYVDRLCGREQILWHLAMAAPVEYLPDGPVRSGFGDEEAKAAIAELKRKTERLRFRVWFDGVELRKPIVLPTTNRSSETLEDPTLPDQVLVRPLRYSSKVEGERVEAEGYLFYQPYRIYPADLRGLLPRLDYVGVGNNRENRFMASLSGENPILRAQISGELFVLKGLHRALDLDRSGFMELDPEYMALVDDVGKSVRTFFLVAKRSRSQSYRERQITRSREKVRETAHRVELWSAERGRPIRVEVTEGIPTPTVERPTPERVSRFGPANKPSMALRSEKDLLELTPEAPDPEVVMLILGFDEILAKYLADPTEARKDLARLVRSVLKKTTED